MKRGSSVLWLGWVGVLPLWRRGVCHLVVRRGLACSVLVGLGGLSSVKLVVVMRGAARVGMG